jgi:hypothetical protein
MLKLASTLLTLILVLALSACGAQPSAPADAPAPAAADADTPDEAPKAEPEAESEVVPAGNRDPQDVVSAALDFERSAAIFEQFQSYRISVSNTQIARSDGNVTETLSTYLEERINAPQIIRTVIGGGADVPANETQIRDGALYQIRADEQRCETSVIDNDTMQMSVDMARSMMSMGFVFAAAGTPELVARGEEVNGIVTDHYRVTRDQNGITVNGDFWVAAEGYLVKAESTSLIADPNGAMFSYNLEVDQVAAIDLPSFCGDPTTLDSAAVPLLDDARDQLMTDQFVGYVTDATPDEAIAFYTERLTAEGYTLNTLQESEYGAVLEALGPDRRLQISISNNTGVTGVSITIEK